MPAASKNLLRPAIQYLLIVIKQGTVHHLPFGIGRIHDHAVSGIDAHMRDVHVSSVWFVAPEHKVPQPSGYAPPYIFPALPPFPAGRFLSVCNTTASGNCSRHNSRFSGVPASTDAPVLIMQAVRYHSHSRWPADHTQGYPLPRSSRPSRKIHPPLSGLPCHTLPHTTH